MPEYCAYIIGDNGDVCDSVPLVCAADDEAKEKARELLVDGRNVQLWQRDRRVAKFDYTPKTKI